MDLITSSLLLGFSVISITTQILLYLHLKSREERKNSVNDKLEIEPLLLETKRKSEGILSHAIKESNAFILEAKKRSEELYSSEKIQSDAVLADFKSFLSEFETRMQTVITQTTSEAQKSYQSYLESIERAVESQITRNESILEEKADRFLHGAQTVLDSYVAKTEKRLEGEIDQEIANAKKEIQSYKEHRMKMIDDNIVEILEKTLEIGVGRHMSLSDQSSLIYKALEQAKLEHHFTIDAKPADLTSSSLPNS